MKVDRHNYEEFFILYWDNELSAVQKQAVEKFVDQNADLREEFEILGESRFTPDAGEQFKEKDFLLSDSFINVTNYEQELLNYIDDELTTDERKEIERFVGLNPAAQKELALLQRTKLQPDEAVSFPDKSVLYRGEERPVRIISMTWFRIAAAAAIVLIAGFTVLQFVNTSKNGNGPDVVQATPPKNTTTTNETKTSNQPVTEPPVKSTDERVAKLDDSPVNETKNAKIKEGEKTADGTLIARTLTSEPVNKNNLLKPGIVNDQNNTEKVFASNNDPAILKNKDRNAMQKNESGALDGSLTDADVTNKPELALYIPEAEAKEKDGGGLKELLRKTTRVFERRTKIQTTTEDNKLLVGAFAVSLK